uniref:Putative secreted protein n=1 Tax=Ixodes ricinus TaxID=34613 RepID=A0A6B0TTZ4_IXORI
MLSTSPLQFNHLLFSLLLPLARHYADCGASSKHLVQRMCTIADDDICTPLSDACAKRFDVTRVFQGGGFK